MGFLIPGSLVRVQPGVLDWASSGGAGPKGSRRRQASPLVRVQPGVFVFEGFTATPARREPGGVSTSHRRVGRVGIQAPK